MPQYLPSGYLSHRSTEGKILSSPIALMTSSTGSMRPLARNEVTTWVCVCDAVGGLLAAIAAWSFLSMSPQPMPSALISMSLCSLWKSSTIAFTAARVAGLGSVSHMVTTTFFCAPAGFTPPTSEAAVAPAAVAPTRARNSRRPRAPVFRSATSRWRSALLSWRMVFLLVAQPGAGQYGSSSVTARLCHIRRARGRRRVRHPPPVVRPSADRVPAARPGDERLHREDGIPALESTDI